MAEPDSRPPSALVVAAALVAGIAGSVLFARGWFATGGGLLLASVAVLRWPFSIWAGEELPDLPPRTRLFLLLAVAVTAAFFRGFRMVPPGLWGDDAINGLLAYEILDGKITSPFQLVHHSASFFHALTNYTIAASFWALGPSMTSLRLPGVVLNFFCVLLLYGTTAPLFRARTALLAAFFFAVSPVQIEHGTNLVQVVTGEFFFLLGMFLLVRGLTGQRRWLIALAGIPFGLTLCTYHTFKLAPLIPVLYGLAVLFERRGERLRLFGWCAVAMIVLAITAAPGFLAYARDPAALTGRISGTSILAVAQAKGSFAPIWDSIWRTLAIFHYQQGPVLYHWFGIGTAPALDAIVATLLLHGFVESVVRWQQPRHFLLLVWFGVGLVPGLLSVEAPRIYRILLATPPVYVWAALPVARLLAFSVLPERRRAYAAIAAAILVIVPLLDFNEYFVRTRTHPDYLWMQASRMVDMARTLKSYGPEWRGVLFATNFDSEHESFEFLKRLWNLNLTDGRSLSQLMPARNDDNILVIFDPPAAPMAAEIEAWYPGTDAIEHRQPIPQTSWLDPWLKPPDPSAQRRLMATYLPLPRSALEARRGLEAVFVGEDGMPLGSQRWTQLALAPDAPRPEGAANAKRVLVNGAVHAPVTGNYALSAQGAALLQLSIDGKPVLTPDHRAAPIDLVEGLHALAAVVDLSQDGGFQVHWQPPDEQAGPISALFLYPDGEIHGWIAEYDNGKKKLRRLEPLPWYQLMASTFDDRYRVHWHGRLRVPEGGRHLSVRTRGDSTVMIDGAPLKKSDKLDAGDHDVDVALENVEGPLMLELDWRLPSGETQRIPASAFLPPIEASADAG